MSCKMLAARYRLSYLAFALGFIFPCAQRCVSSRDIFLRAAALILRTGLDAWDCFAFAHRARWAAAILARVAAENVRRLRIALGGLPALLRPVEFRPPIAAIARSMRSRSARSSARMLLMSMIAPRAGIVTVPQESGNASVPVTRRKPDSQRSISNAMPQPRPNGAKAAKTLRFLARPGRNLRLSLDWGKSARRGRLQKLSLRGLKPNSCFRR